MRLIDADALKEKVLSEDPNPWIVNIVTSGIIEALDNAPTIDAEPVRHGRWEKADNLKPKCSVCGEFHLYSWTDHKKCNFCPNCGAKMDKEINDGTAQA